MSDSPKAQLKEQVEAKEKQIQELNKKNELLDQLLSEQGQTLKQIKKENKSLKKAQNDEPVDYSQEANLRLVYAALIESKKNGEDPKFEDQKLQAFYHHIMSFKQGPKLEIAPPKHESPKKAGKKPHLDLSAIGAATVAERSASAKHGKAHDLFDKGSQDDNQIRKGAKTAREPRTRGASMTAHDDELKASASPRMIRPHIPKAHTTHSASKDGAPKEGSPALPKLDLAASKDAKSARDNVIKTERTGVAISPRMFSKTDDKESSKSRPMSLESPGSKPRTSAKRITTSSEKLSHDSHNDSRISQSAPKEHHHIHHPLSASQTHAGSGHHPLSVSQTHAGSGHHPRKDPAKSASQPSTVVSQPVRAKGAIRTALDIKEITGKVNASWSKSAQESCLFGDLPRIAPRVSFISTVPGHIHNIVPDPNFSNNQQTAILLKALVESLEKESVYTKVSEFLDKTTQTAADGALWMEEVFNIIGLDSKTTNLAKSLHQGIIMPAATQLKVVMFSATNQITKDVRTNDGWQVLINLSPNQIIAKHTRKEVAMLPGKDHFQFQWNLILNFSESIDSISKISLSAENLTLDKNFDPTMAEKLKKCLADMETA